MKLAHLIKLTVFSHEDENSQPILDALLRFFPFNLQGNKVQVNTTTAEGFNEKKIEILEVTLTKTSLIHKFLKNLFKNLDKEQKNNLLHQVESRLDKNLVFFLRFDKDASVHEKRLVLTDSSKCFHLKISVATFPRKRKLALNVIKDMFS